MFVGSVRSTYPQDPGASLEMERRLAIVEETHRFAGFRCQKALLEGIHLSEAHNRQSPSIRRLPRLLPGQVTTTLEINPASISL